MAVIRAFVAAELSGKNSVWFSSVQTEIRKLVEPTAIKLTPLSQFHITLAFLGDIETQSISAITKAMDSCMVKLPISVSIDRLGNFSQNGKISVIWAGIKPDKLLADINSELLKRILPLVKFEKSPFKPHLTMARIRSEIEAGSNERLSKFMQSNQLSFPVHDSIINVVLFKSELRPTGPIYTRLYTIEWRDRIQ
jgi:2'-5' RNA ligase